MDATDFFALDHGRAAKGLMLRCLERLVSISKRFVGGQVSNPDSAHQAYCDVCAQLEEINAWFRCDGKMSFPVDAEAIVGSAVTRTQALQQFAQGSDPGMSEIYSIIQSVALALTELPIHIRIEQARTARR